MYSFCYRILEENGDTVRASGLCIELGNALLSVGKNGEAASFYQRAADLRSDYIGLEYVHAREKVASCQIGKNKFVKSFGIQSFQTKYVSFNVFKFIETFMFVMYRDGRLSQCTGCID